MELHQGTKDDEELEDLESSENVNILDSPPRARSMGSIFSKYSTLSYRTSGRDYRFTLIIISLLAVFMTGMTIGTLLVRFIVCDGEKNLFLNKFSGNMSNSISRLYDTI